MLLPACGEPFAFSTGSSATASGSGAGTGGAVAGTGGAVAGTGGAAVEQDCFNGLDDDGDGLTDCEDPDCSSFSCVAAPPAGWVSAWIEPNGSPAPCPPELANQIDLFDPNDIDAPPASCSCACGAAAGVLCSTHLRCDPSVSQCGGAGPANGQSTNCASNIPNVSFPAFCRADPPGAFGGTCAPSAVGAPAPWSWAPSKRACGIPVGGKCADSGSICVPQLAGASGPCVTQAGDLACPAPYSKKKVFYDGETVVDDRGCNGAACTCGAPIGSTCDCGALGCAIDLYSDSACGAMQGVVPASSVYSLVQSKPSSAKIVGGISVAGPCAPDGEAQSKGGVTPTGPVTVCCLP